MNATNITTYVKSDFATEVGKKLKINNENDTEKEKDTSTEILLEDTVEISEDGINKARKKQEELERMEREKDELMKQLENIREQNDAAADALNTRMKCLTIAMRIMSGDKVPTQDQRYLAKNDPEMYGRATIMKLQNNNPKEHKRLSEDEEASGEVKIVVSQPTIKSKGSS